METLYRKVTFEIEQQDNYKTVLIGKNANFIFNPNTRNGEELTDFLSGCEEITDTSHQIEKLEADKAELLERRKDYVQILQIVLDNPANNISKSTIDLIGMLLREFENTKKYNTMETLFKPMTELPPQVESEDFSETVLVYDTDLDDCDLGFYNFDTQRWGVLGGFKMNLICWRHIEKPKYEDVQEYLTILTD